jgi:hypothetical protein
MGDADGTGRAIGDRAVLYPVGILSGEANQHLGRRVATSETLNVALSQLGFTTYL